jgi:hypothetical protein
MSTTFFKKFFSSCCFCVARLRQQIILYHHIKGCAIVFFDIISTLLKNISNLTMPIAPTLKRLLLYIRITIHFRHKKRPRISAASFMDQSRWRICGKSRTSRIEGEFVSNMTSLSIPIPSPPVGGIPYSSASMKSSSIIWASSFPSSRSFN